MTGTEYQRKAMRTAQGLTEWDLLLNGVMGLCGEAGECIDLVKKYRFQGHQLDQEKLKDELGDVMWYVAITCQALGITLDDVIEHNYEFEENDWIFYRRPPEEVLKDGKDD